MCPTHKDNVNYDKTRNPGELVSNFLQAYVSIRFTVSLLMSALFCPQPASHFQHLSSLRSPEKTPLTYCICGVMKQMAIE